MEFPWLRPIDHLGELHMRNSSVRPTVGRRIFTSAYKIGQRIATLDVTHLMRLDLETASPPPEPPGFTFRFVTAKEITSFTSSENDLPPELAARVDLGFDFCFAALADDQLASYAWFALGSIEAEHNRGEKLNSGVAMSFPEELAFMYKGFTYPEFRGKGLYGHVSTKALQGLQPHGVSTVISTADWSNESALKSCWRLGFKDLGLVWRAGVGPLMVTHAPRKGKSLGIKFGRKAVVRPRI